MGGETHELLSTFVSVRARTSSCAWGSWPWDKSVVRLPTVMTRRHWRWVSVAVEVCGSPLVNSLIFSRTETPWLLAKNDEWEKGRDVRKQMGDRADVVLVPGVRFTPEEGSRDRKVSPFLPCCVEWRLGTGNFFSTGHWFRNVFKTHQGIHWVS